MFDRLYGVSLSDLQLVLSNVTTFDFKQKKLRRHTEKSLKINVATLESIRRKYKIKTNMNLGKFTDDT